MAAAGIAVVPFGVTGQGFDLWREGMVDVVSTSLENMGGWVEGYAQVRIGKIRGGNGRRERRPNGL